MIPFSLHMKRNDLSYAEMIEFAGTDDACTDYYAAQDCYIIYYNDIDLFKISSNRYRWNIAHELGHIALNHHKKYSESRIFRNSLSKQRYKSLEDEADMFAAYILVPHIVVRMTADKDNPDIKSICKISGKASEYRRGEMKLWNEKKAAERYDLDLLGFFSQFVESRAYSPSISNWLDSLRACPACKGHILDSAAQCCSVCGQKFTGHYESRRRIMFYEGADVDSKLRLIECPTCHNEQPYDEGTYCIICGSSLVNQCLNAVSKGEIEPWLECNYDKVLPANARYCPCCGYKTSFFSRNLLRPWNEPRVLSIEDGELPF